MFMAHARRKILLFMALLAALTLLLTAACGGDDEDEGEEAGPTATAAEEEDGGDGDGEETPAAEEDDGGGDGDDLGAQLQELGSEWGNVAGRVTYRITDSTGESSMTLYQDPPDKSRIDFQGESGDFIVITTTDATYSCTSTDGEGFCFEGPAEEGSVPLYFQAYAAPEVFEGLFAAGDGIDVERFEDEIAGENAACFRAGGEDLFLGEEGSYTWCFAENGLLLLSSVEAESGDFTMEATEIGDVSDDDFEPPYDVTDIGG